MIINLYKSKTQQQPNVTYKNLMKLISQEVGIGNNTVCNTVSDYKKNKEVKSPNKKKFVQQSMTKLTTLIKMLSGKKYTGFGLKTRFQR